MTGLPAVAKVDARGEKNLRLLGADGGDLIENLGSAWDEVAGKCREISRSRWIVHGVVGKAEQIQGSRLDISRRSRHNEIDIVNIGHKSQQVADFMGRDSFKVERTCGNTVRLIEVPRKSGAERDAPVRHSE